MTDAVSRCETFRVPFPRYLWRVIFLNMYRMLSRRYRIGKLCGIWIVVIESELLIVVKN
jgi:hypothetical protein